MSITLDGTNGIDTPAINAGNIVGEVAFFALNTPPTGWLKANGASVSRTTYADLFNAIGTTFGSGDGSTTFNLPDMRGEFPRGWDDGRGVDSGRGFGTAQLDAFQGHGHSGPNRGNDGSPGTNELMSGVNLNTIRNLLVGNPRTTNFGSVRIANETRPRNIALLACIKF